MQIPARPAQTVVGRESGQAPKSRRASMPRPTTRSGRYLYYRARFRKRLMRIRGRKRGASAAGHHSTSYARDVSGLQLQSIAQCSRVRRYGVVPASFLQFVYTPPGGYGIPPRWSVFGPPWYVNSPSHSAVGHLRKQFRRLRRCPRLRHLQIIPFGSPKGDPPHWSDDWYAP